ncbi:MAG TPA: hypothetical protein VK698_16125 [Kofleriaceae bacterium]|nr:hypothetical protein [Kofleriaceae bacterium]
MSLFPSFMSRLPLVRSLALVVVCAGASACGSDSPAEPIDAGVVDAGFSCEPEGEPGEPFDLQISLTTDGVFRELVDGDMAPVVLGPQGLYMLELEVRATLSIPSESICLHTLADVSAWEQFNGITQPGVIGMRTVEDGSFSGIAQIILAGGAEMAQNLDGAEVVVTMACDGHGLSGSISRDLNLFLAD